MAESIPDKILLFIFNLKITYVKLSLDNGVGQSNRQAILLTNTILNHLVSRYGPRLSNDYYAYCWVRTILLFR